MTSYIGNRPTSSTGVGGPNPTQLNIPGVIATPPTYNVTKSDQGYQILGDASSGGVTVNLPNTSSVPEGFTVFVKKTDGTANTVVVDGDGTETVNGQASITISSQWDGIGIQKSGSEWISIVSSGAGAGASGGSGSGGGGGVTSSGGSDSQPAGSFDTGIDSLDSLNLTSTTITNGYQYTGTGTAIVFGVLASNKNDTTEVEVDMLTNDSSQATDFYQARNIPIPAKNSIELIKRPKVLKQNDQLKFRTNLANETDITVRYAEFDSNADTFNLHYEGTPSAVGAFETIYTESGVNGSVFESFLLANAEVSDVEATIKISDGVGNPVVVNKLNVPAKTSIELAEIPYVLKNGDSINVQITQDPTYLHITMARRTI